MKSCQTMGLDELPDELLLRIFTITSDMAFQESSWDDGIPRGQPHVMKAAVRKLQLVCRRWRALVHLKSNSHFWLTRMSLIHHYPSPHDPSSIFLVPFFEHLNSSQGSDLRVDIIFPRELEGADSVADTPPPNSLFTVSRLVMHGCATLMSHSDNLLCLDIHVSSSEQWSLI